MSEPWQGQTFSFRREQPTEEKLRNVEWVTIRKDDGTEEHWPVEVDEIVSDGDGGYTVRLVDPFTGP
jgi:hypothetical protein